LIDHFGYHKHHEGLVRTESKTPPPPPPPGQYTDGAVKKEEENTYVKRLSEEKQRENVEEMLKRDGDLIFISPMLEGFSLKAKLWRKSPPSSHPLTLETIPY
jgi:hypothetical protein